MGFVNLILSVFQAAGLALINLPTCLGDSTKSTQPYGPHPRQVLDWYMGEGKNRPLVIFFYGGNWQAGRRSDYRFVADSLLGIGFDVVIPDYRLFPEVRFGEIIADARASVDHILGQRDKRVFLMGHSAGAQLAALLTLDSHRDHILGFIGLAGPYDFYPFTEKIHWKIFSPSSDYCKSQPVNYVNPLASPLYLLHGENDMRVRRGHSKSLMEKQRKVGGKADREVYASMGHVGIILSFARIRRHRSTVISDIRRFIENETRECSFD